MGYFNYHAKVEKKINTIGVKYFSFEQEYHGISPVLLITFNDNSVMPVREHKFDEYVQLLKIDLK